MEVALSQTVVVKGHHVRILGIRISNYKSFLDSDVITFDQGFNVVIGRNNTGKTALLETLSLDLSNQPHLSTKSKPRVTSEVFDSLSQVEVRVGLSWSELAELATNRKQIVSFYRESPLQISTPEEASAIVESFTNSSAEHEVIVRVNGSHSALVSIVDAPTIENMTVYALPIQFLGHDSEPTIPAFAHNGSFTTQSQDGSTWLLQDIKNRIYRFKAERMNVGVAEGMTVGTLAADASNLPLVLRHLATQNAPRFSRYVDLICSILPDIHWISTDEVSQGQYQVLMWPIDVKTERADLAIPLTDSGTGVGQILAILYVAITSDSPRTIIVDEPQSFLHPGALRKLVDILRYEQNHDHQYIFSSHSPQVIASAAPSAFHLVSKTRLESRVERMDASNVEHQRSLLAELGATMSDVLSAENILWVEGSTEEGVFPLVLSGLSINGEDRSNRLLGTGILALVATGDLESKNRESVRRAAKIYRKLSSGHSLLPPALGFILDPEYRTPAQKRELETTLAEHVYWLPRTMYENYLLNSAAIAHLIFTFKIETSGKPDREKVRKALEVLLGKAEFYNDGNLKVPLSPEDRLKKVHGGKLLNALLRELIGGTGYDYKTAKVEYGIILTRWIIENEPEELREVFDLLVKALAGREDLKS